MASTGCLTTEWREVLQEAGGLKPEDSMEAISKVAKAMRSGAGAGWRARNKRRAKEVGAERVTHNDKLEQVLERWRRREAAAGRQLPDGAEDSVRQRSKGAQRRWMEAMVKGQRSMVQFCIYGPPPVSNGATGDGDTPVQRTKRQHSAARRQAHIAAAAADVAEAGPCLEGRKERREILKQQRQKRQREIVLTTMHARSEAVQGTASTIPCQAKVKGHDEGEGNEPGALDGADEDEMNMAEKWRLLHQQLGESIARERGAQGLVEAQGQDGAGEVGTTEEDAAGMYLEALADVRKFVAKMQNEAMEMEAADRTSMDEQRKRKATVGQQNEEGGANRMKRRRLGTATGIQMGSGKGKRKADQVEGGSAVNVGNCSWMGQATEAEGESIGAKRKRADQQVSKKRGRDGTQECKGKMKQQKLSWDAVNGSSCMASSTCLSNSKVGDGNQIDLLSGTVARGID